jgi:catechol 2,3-dioxygenase-like lactoylglutathione lyase family enzyme
LDGRRTNNGPVVEAGGRRPCNWVLAQTDARHAAPFHRRQAGLNQLAFSVTNAAAVDVWTSWLKDRGIPILYADRHPHASGPGYYGVFFEDPDRIKIEIVAAGSP